MLSALLAIGFASAVTPLLAKQPPSPAISVLNDVLARTIIQRFSEDQALLADMTKAKEDPEFLKTFKMYERRTKKESNPNFYDPMVYELWATMPDAPGIVRRYVAFRKATDTLVESTVNRRGWPQRAAVGDEAAADFLFPFGHADDDNTWRVTQLSTIDRVFREDHVNPQMYAHLCDRLSNVAGKPQIYGSVMGPGSAPATAKLYWPLIDSVSAADKRRARIGLPSIEDELERFRQGAEIGPYMTPLTKGMNWSMADVYAQP